PPVCVQPVRHGVTLPVREPSAIDTSGAGAAVVTVMFSGWPGGTVFGGCLAGTVAGNRPTTAATPTPNTSRRVMRFIFVSLLARVESSALRAVVSNSPPDDHIHRRGKQVRLAFERP